MSEKRRPDKIIVAEKQGKTKWIRNRLELPACSTPVCVTVTTFRGGIPISRVVVRDFEDEEESE